MKRILQDLYRLQTLDLRAPTGDRSEADNLRLGIPQGMLTNYDRARARGKKGIAILRNHVCTNCRMQSPVAVTAALKGGAIQTCGNCGLYLCLDPDEPVLAATTEAPALPKPRKKKTSTKASAAEPVTPH